MSMHNNVLVAIAICSVTAIGSGQPQRVGEGSYDVGIPFGAKGPPRTIYRTQSAQGHMPTNDWWSSLAWERYSSAMYPHPLAMRAEEGGLRAYYPGATMSAAAVGVLATMAGGGRDVVLGMSDVARFDDARVDGWSDWFVAARFSAGEKWMRVTFGHGSPYVYATFGGGHARLVFADLPQVWAGDVKSPTLGVTVGGRHYGLFGPSGCAWEGLGTKVITCRGRAYFSLALLPDKSDESLALFARHAHAHVADTRVSWAYEPKDCVVTTKFEYVTEAMEGTERGTLYALYPHQWRRTDARLTAYGYASVRGTMKLAAGTGFATRTTFPGVLPGMPLCGSYDKTKLQAMLKDDVDRRAPATKDTYWEGKYLGKLATLAPIAEQIGDREAADRLLGEMRRRLEGWLTAGGKDGEFRYNSEWGALIGYPASFGSDDQLNDHHFHYGYYIRAAAEVARHEPGWATEQRWGGMVKMLVRDIASAIGNDGLFPRLRNFDPYAGHSWAAGHAKFADGNNNESSSEAMNAWCGLILWGEATGDRALRDLGVWLYTTEMEAIEEYWFDVHDENFPKGYPREAVAMVWGGKSVHETWFGADPEFVHGINWLPMHAGSLYLGRHPEYAERNYAECAQERGGQPWKHWGEVMWMYRALSDAAEARRAFEADDKANRREDGTAKANAYQWICALEELGRVERSVTADYPVYAVFTKGGKRSYVVYNMGDASRVVRFSDGRELKVDPRSLGVAR